MYITYHNRVDIGLRLREFQIIRLAGAWNRPIETTYLDLFTSVRQSLGVKENVNFTYIMLALY